jgi:hypothetical protein
MSRGHVFKDRTRATTRRGRGTRERNEMVSVYCTPTEPFLELLTADGDALLPYCLTPWPEMAAVCLEIVAKELRAPFVVHGAGEVVVSTHLAPEIARYAGISEVDYLRTMVLGGLLVARAMQLNPLMRVDDFRHANPVNCLLSDRFFLDEYFQLMESPCLCRGCRVFYGELCPGDEVAALERQLARVAAARDLAKL